MFLFECLFHFASFGYKLYISFFFCYTVSSAPTFACDAPLPATECAQPTSAYLPIANLPIASSFIVK